MDPIANLNEQRALAAEIIGWWDSVESFEALDELGKEDMCHKAARLAELVQALDEWQAGGGFSPYEKKGA